MPRLQLRGGPFAGYTKHSDECRSRFSLLAAKRLWPPPSASAMLAEVLRGESFTSPHEDLPPACFATWLSEPASVKPRLAEAAEVRDSLEAFIAGVEEEFNELKQALDEEALSSFMKTDLPERIASALAAEAIPASPSQTKNKESSRVLIEFCCHPESELGKLAGENGITCHRLSRDWANLEDPNIIEQVVQIVRKSPNCLLHASLPCTVWSTWQYMSSHTQGEKYVRRLLNRRRKAIELFKNFVTVATEVRKHGGTISFEWPRHCLGWLREEVLQFISSFQLTTADFDGCAFGLMHEASPTIGFLL